MKKLLLIATVITFAPVWANAAWWQPSTWFGQKAQVIQAIEPIATPVVIEKTIEVPVEKIVERIVEKPVEKVVTRTVDNPELVNEIARLKAEIARLNKFCPAPVASPISVVTTSNKQYFCNYFTDIYNDIEVKQKDIEDEYQLDIDILKAFVQTEKIKGEIEERSDRYNSDLAPILVQLSKAKEDMDSRCK